MITARQILLDPSKYAIKSPYEMQAEYITVHNTANDASAENEIKYMISNNNQVSFHFAIDDIEVIQGLPLERNGWHSGDGNGDGNRKSIGVEICYSKSGGDRYTASENRAVIFIAQLLKERNWGVDRLRQHFDWSGKNCPHRIRDEKRWNEFVSRISNLLTNDTPTPQTPQTPPTSSYTGHSIVAYLNSIGQDSSFNNRKKLAEKHGITNYTGTAEQNLKLLAILRSSTSLKPQQNNVYSGVSIVAYLNSIGQDSSFNNRKKLANKNGINNYTGTAEQNLKLLRILRGF